MNRLASSSRAKKKSKQKGRFFLVGSRLCVDFANTLRAPNQKGDTLSSWDDIVAFLAVTAVTDKTESSRLRARSRAEPQRCAKAFEGALELRQALRKILSAIEKGDKIPAEWIEPINAILRSARGYEKLENTSDRWRMAVVTRNQGPGQWLVPIARSAAELLEEGPAAPVRKCGGADCVLYFYDTSRTGRRRWCSMAACGNRHKVSVYAHRHRRALGKQT